jgi:hypothetical protein
MRSPGAAAVPFLAIMIARLSGIYLPAVARDE